MKPSPPVPRYPRSFALSRTGYKAGQCDYLRIPFPQSSLVDRPPPGAGAPARTGPRRKAGKA